MLRRSRPYVVRWGIGLAMVAIIVSQSELSSAMGDIAGIENENIRWSIGLLIVFIAISVFVKYGPRIPSNTAQDGR